MSQEDNKSDDKLGLLFVKSNLVNEKESEIEKLRVEIINLLFKWYNNHKEEIENDLGEEEPVEWFGDWHINKKGEYITLTLTVGYGDDSYYRRIGLYPDGHWEYIPY